MTITSLTDNNTEYETDLNHCTCWGFQRWGHCKHHEAMKLAYARARARIFNELWERYDERSQTRRCSYELAIGA